MAFVGEASSPRAFSELLSQTLRGAKPQGHHGRDILRTGDFKIDPHEGKS